MLSSATVRYPTARLLGCNLFSCFQPQPVCVCVFFCWGKTDSFEREWSASDGGRSAVAMCGAPGKADGNVGRVPTNPGPVRSLSTVA